MAQETQDRMDVDEHRIAASRESRLTEQEINELHDIARRFKEAARNSRQDEDMGGEGEERDVILWKVPVQVSINT
jgi:hypothetical protein